MCLGGSYSAAFRYLAKRTRRGVIFDLGANIGCFSLCSAHAHREARVVAYEPEPSNAAAFADNLALNAQLAPRIVLVVAAVAGTSGTTRLNISGNLAGSNIIEGHVDSSTRHIDVRVAEFADLVRSTCDPIELVKMDIEGSEFSIVDQTPAGVWDRVPAIAMEIHADEKIDMTRAQLIERFRALGYTVASDHMNSWFFERTD